ncbi:alpha/beta hydrolase [Thermodesulfobacteriota bacterium]
MLSIKMAVRTKSLLEGLVTYTTLALIALALTACVSAEQQQPQRSAAPAVTSHRTPDRTPARKSTDSPRLKDQAVPRGNVSSGKTPSPTLQATPIYSSKPSPAGAKGPIVENLKGYKIPAEYLIINSSNFPQAIVAVGLPTDYGKNRKKRYPLVIAFGGAGECARAPRKGALAWLDFYKTDEAVRALGDSRLESGDFRGFVTPRQLEGFNQQLQDHPYGGIILVCPYSPPLRASAELEDPQYEAFIVKELIPILKERYRVSAIGVDGVSMGGARSMFYGFKYPELFSSIGSLQGAFGPFFPVYEELVKKNKDELKRRDIQLVTSDRDPLAPSVRRMHQLLTVNGIPHGFSVLTGPHDYIFNQGPGSLALLVFHNKSLGKRAQGPVR